MQNTQQANESLVRPLTHAWRNALVTGASSGMGAATAKALGQAGANVALLGRRAERLAEVAASAGLPLVADVADDAQLRAAFAAAREQFGPLDLVVANAGAMLGAPFDKADQSEWRQMIDTNLTGLLATARLASDDLLAIAEQRRPADLVLISSIGAHLVMNDYAVYFATKAAVTHLGRVLRAEYGPRGVRVHVVEPGLVATELGAGTSDPSTRAGLDQLLADNPPIPAERIADLVLWMTALPADTNVSTVELLPTVQG